LYRGEQVEVDGNWVSVQISGWLNPGKEGNGGSDPPLVIVAAASTSGLDLAEERERLFETF